MNYTEQQIQTAKMLVQYYNLMAGGHIRTSNEANYEVVLKALGRFGGDVRSLKTAIKTYTANNECIGASAFGECFESLGQREAQQIIIDEVESIAETPEAPKTQGVTEKQVQYSMGILEQAVIGLIAKTQTERIEREIMGGVKETISQFIKDNYGAIERKVETVVDGKKVELQGVQHEKFETVLKFVANNEPVFLTGPAGSGKNVLCKQVAQALGLKFYFTNAVTQEYKLTGFTDAMGNYQPTQFYEAFTKGGVFMLDEMDASIPEVLVILNAAIANRYFDFPAPIGYVEAHKDFRVIAAGNTIGQGASYEYVGRNQLDAASLDRFAIVKMDYSPAIELNVANGDEELVSFCRDYRDTAAEVGQQVIVSYRAIGRLAKMLQLLTVEEALITCLVKGIEKDDLKLIIDAMKTSGKYVTALKRIHSMM